MKSKVENRRGSREEATDKLINLLGTQSKELAPVQAMVDHMGEPLLVVDPASYHVVLANRAAREMAEGREVTSNMACYRFLHARDAPCDRAGEQCPVEQVTATKAPVKLTEKKTLREGEQKTFDIVATPVLDEDREVAYVVESFRDITEREKLGMLRREEREFFKSAMRSISPSALFVIGEGRTILDCNEAVAGIWGYTREELIGRGTEILYPSREEFLEFGKRLYKALEERGYYIEEIRGRRKNGEAFHADVSASKVRARNEIVVIVRDVTERKLAEETLKEIEERYRGLIESSRDVIFTLSPEGKINFLSPVFEEVTGFKAEEWIGRPFQELLHPEDVPQAVERFQRSLKGATNPLHELRFLKKSGGYVIGELATTAKLHAGKVVGVEGIARDITERKRIERKIKETGDYLQNIVRTTPDAIITTDLEGRTVSWNPGAERLYGWSEEEVAGRRLPWVPGELKQEAEEMMEKVRRGEEYASYETKRRRKDGTLIDVNTTVSPLRDADGKIIGVTGIARDITERKRAEDVLRNIARGISATTGEEFFRSLVKHIASALKVDYAFIGEMKEEGGEEVETVAVCAHDEIVENFVYNLSATPCAQTMGKSFCYYEDVQRLFPEDHLLKELGAESYMGTPLFDSKGSPLGIMVILHNRELDNPQLAEYMLKIFAERATSELERKKAEEALKRYAGKLEESNRMKELFGDILHHDLVNPLGVAKGFVLLLQEEEDDPGKLEGLGKAQKNLLKAEEIIENARKLSRLESIDSLEIEELDLRDMIAEVVEGFEPLAREAGMQIENSVARSMRINASRTLEDVFANLISNAIKYAPQSRRVVIDGEEEESHLKVRVTDFGPGIADEYKESIFTRFERKHREGIQGTGLGLAIARRIVELHQGKVWVEDTPGGGATFMVELPREGEPSP